ncbi:MAG: flagellar basal body rod protein FlgB [Deltaproteobacteria bacterium]|nr:flagellar basal body rod protein FlgB [Deltaproteobacteria bacterium]MCX7953140.1 flagellar basal body rod protein FlgB [Deltaproteobacteria bacterium]
MSFIDKILTDANNLSETALRLASTRQKIIASNLANLETPGYRAKDLKFFDHLKGMFEEPKDYLETTSDKHFKNSVAQHNLKPKEDLSGNEKPDGNNVDLDVEMARLQFTKGYFQTASLFLKTRFQMILNVIRSF